MFNTIGNVTKDILTEKDGQSFDITKVIWVIGTLVYFGCTFYDMIKNHASFNYLNWSVGFAGILAAGSAGVKIKETTEQNVDVTSNQGPPAANVTTVVN